MCGVVVCEVVVVAVEMMVQHGSEPVAQSQVPNEIVANSKPMKNLKRGMRVNDSFNYKHKVHHG